MLTNCGKLYTCTGFKSSILHRRASKWHVDHMRIMQFLLAHKCRISLSSCWKFLGNCQNINFLLISIQIKITSDLFLFKSVINSRNIQLFCSYYSTGTKILTYPSSRHSLENSKVKGVLPKTKLGQENKDTTFRRIIRWCSHTRDALTQRYWDGSFFQYNK